MSKIYKPIHYTKDNIEVIEFIEQVIKHYPTPEAYHIGKHYGHEDYVDVKVQIIETGKKSENI